MTPSATPIEPARLERLLAVADLSQDPSHAIGQMAHKLSVALEDAGYPAQRKILGPAIVPARQNYQLLGYPPDAVVQADTYTQWVDGQRILRTQATSVVLPELASLVGRPRPATILAPAMVYRRDVRDRWHCAQPHQMDVWVLTPRTQATPEALRALVDTLACAGMPGVELRVDPTSHPYTCQGIEIHAMWQGQWLEVAEAGLIAPDLLARLGLDPSQWGGLAMGLGLDRWVMVAKALPDIRLLRDPLPAVAHQMRDLLPWRPVSRQPLARRELSLACQPGLSTEALTQQVIDALGDQATLLQAVEVKGRWPLSALPACVAHRLGATMAQENVLVALEWQCQHTSLPRERVNAMARLVYRQIHQGSAWEYCP